MPELIVHRDEETFKINVDTGANLRRTLLDHDISPYAPIPDKVNCGGRGLCATCGVWIEAGEPAPQHWHDKIGSRFGYPRLSCQITIETDMTVRILTDKWLWGTRQPERAWNKQQSK